jgi:hypothetical protein
MARRAHRAKRTSRGLCVQPLEARRCLAGIGFAEHPIGGHLLGGSSGMTVGDLNGDGHLDFISTGSNPIAWRSNDGNANFGENRLVTTELDWADYIIAGDVDSDGDNDVVALSRLGELAWFENRDGLGTFGPKQTIAQIDELTWSLKAGDLDNDGDLDLVRSGRNSSNERYTDWYANISGGDEFQQQRLSNDLVHAIVDLDHDGDLDVVMDDAWLENSDGQGNYVQRPRLIETRGRRLLVDDVDNNGRIDLITSAPGNSHWSEATDDPTVFVLRSRIDVNLFDPDSVDLFWYPGDVDLDGDKDLVAITYDWFYGTSGVTWYELVGSEYIYRDAIASGVGHDMSLLVADLNGDRRQDVLYYGGDGQTIDLRPGPQPTAWYAYQDNQEAFGDPNPINEIFDSATALATADIDGDGDLDVIHATTDCHYFCYHPDIAWIENLDGSHAFGRRSVIYTERLVDMTFRRLWPADIDGDGDVDIAAIKAREPVWFENLDGKGNFGGEQAIEGVPPDATLLVHDLDDDGRVDLLAVNEENRTLDWYSYDVSGGPWTFVRTAISSWPAWQRGTFLAGDLDGDGDQDLAFSSGALFSWFERLDEVSFAAGRALLPEVDPGAPDLNDPVLVALADFDGDEDLDVVYSVWRDGRRDLTWLENHGGGRFVPARRDLTLGEFGSLYALADLDGDEDFDIVSAEWWGVRWLENRLLGDANGDGRFDSADLVQILAAGKYEDDVPRNTTFDEGDWNGDGEFTTADLVLAMQTGQYDTAAAIGEPEADVTSIRDEGTSG